MKKMAVTTKNLFRRARMKYAYLNKTNGNTSILESSALISRGYSEGYYLDENSIFDILNTPSSIEFPRWMQILHCIDKRTALILIPGETLVTPVDLNITKDSHFYIRYSAALEDISKDGLICEISFIKFDEPSLEKLIATFPITGGRQSGDWRTADLDISFLAGQKGKFILRCDPGPDGDSTADWLAISDLCIAREDQLPLVKARSFQELRSHNEIKQFSAAYEHSMYKSMHEKNRKIAAGKSRPVRKLSRVDDKVVEMQSVRAVDVEPLPDESQYGYASRLLYDALSAIRTPPNFIERLKSKTNSPGSIKILSLCSGAARTEARYAAQAGSGVEWTLLDINADLLRLASKQFAPSIKLDLIEANANDLTYSGEKWDIILCVSALHHIVELEKLIKFCRDSLSDDGEFWSIGEYVGKNGNRLWPDAKEEANKFFQQLPERYRFNNLVNQVDSEIPDNDCSVGCFEGIRSEDILPTLDRWFEPQDVYLRNCFQWRLINQTYSDNYDLQKPEDRILIAEMVNAELNHFKAGGRGTELFGVYRPRLN